MLVSLFLFKAGKPATLIVVGIIFSVGIVYFFYRVVGTYFPVGLFFW
jgi:hypothetical protein